MTDPFTPPQVGPPPSIPPPARVTSPPSQPTQAKRRSKSLAIGAAAAVTFGLVAGAFVVGRVTADPKTTDEYREQTSKLQSARDEVSTVKQQLETSAGQIEALEGDLSDAEAQLDALTAALPAGEPPNGPVLSEGIAIAARNIKIGVKTRRQECFGSAGCSVTVQIVPDYVGNQDVSTGSWEITYEIRGGEDGPIIETMTLTGGTFSFPEEQSVSTASSGTKLTAVATDVAALD